MSDGTGIEPRVDVYPVGWMAVWRDPIGTEFRGEWQRMADNIKRRRWRAVRNMFNGYLAEPVGVSMLWHRCGHGWTKRRALADLARHLQEVNPDE